MILGCRFANALCHCLHVAPGKPAIGVQALVDDDEVLRLAEGFPVIAAEKAADIDERVFLRRHCATVRHVADFPQYLADGFVLIAVLALANEPRVLDRTRGVEHDRDVVAVAPRAQLAQVGHGEGLPAGHIHVALETDVWNAPVADFVDERIQLRNIDVALEWKIRLRVVGLVDDHVDESSARQLLVQARGREVHVARHMVAVLDEDLRHQVFGAAALVCRHEVLVAVILPHYGFEVVEILAAGIGLVAQHHAGPLPIAHRRGARVG